jgi:hypothetical protein
MDFLQGGLSGKREMFEGLCGLNRIKLLNSRETGSKTTASARTGELSLAYIGAPAACTSHPAILDLDECLMIRSQLRSLNRILYTMRKW